MTEAVVEALLQKFGKPDDHKERFDLAIEIVITNGSIDKLAAYKRLGIPKVWFWEKEKLSFHQLQVNDHTSI